MGKFMAGYDGVATMLGAIIGAGILGLPFVMAAAGVWPGIVMLIGVGIVVCFMNMMLAEVVLRTKGDHQLVGYTRIYLGKWGGFLMMVSVMVGICGALLAYLIGIGSSLKAIFGYNEFVWICVTLIVLGAILFQRLRIIEQSERYMSTFKVLLIVLVVGWSLFSGKLSLQNMTPATSWTLPFGVVLFAYLGTAMIPTVREGMKRHLRLLMPVVVVSTAIPALIYLCFSLAVVGVTGAGSTEVATVGLGNALGHAAVLLLNIFAVVAMASAFLAYGEAVKKTFEEDYDWKPLISWFVVLAVPLALVLIGASSFIHVLGVTGALAGSLDGILIVLMYRAARKHGTRKPESDLSFSPLIQLVVVAVFVAGFAWGLKQLAGLF